MEDLVAGIEGDVDILVGSTIWEDPKQFDVELAGHMKRKTTAHPNALIQFVVPENFAADMVALSGGLQWPPPTDFMVGIEVKCSHLDPNIDWQKDNFDESDLKSTKSSTQSRKKIRGQLNKLHQLGFNKIALLDIIANPPTEGINMGAWINASILSSKTETTMLKVLGDRLLPNSPAGHWAYSVGAVSGADEITRGAGYPRKYRVSQEIAYCVDKEMHEHRKQMEQNITRIFSSLPKPNALPALFINCRTCRKIHTCSINIPCCQ